MSTQNEHLHRRDYDTLTAALIDAERILDDLVDAVIHPTALFLDPDATEFLVKRARRLVSAAREASEGALR